LRFVNIKTLKSKPSQKVFAKAKPVFYETEPRHKGRGGEETKI